MPTRIHDEWPNYGGELDDAVWNRIRASASHEEGDRVPIWDYIDNRPTLDHFRQPGDGLNETMVRVYHGLGIDLCRGYGGAFGAEDEGAGGEHDDWRISGLTRWETKHTISSYGELAAYEPRMIGDEDCEQWTRNVRDAQERMAPHTYFVPGVGAGFHEVYALMGQTFFSYAIYDARKDLDRLFELYSANSVRIARTAAETKLGPLFFTWADIAYKNRLLFSPQFMRETFIPMLRAVCEPLLEAGMVPIFHSDGDVTELLDDMVGAGIRGLNPIEPMAGMDIGQVKRRYGEELILVGNVDCSQVLPLGTVEDVVEATKQCLRDGGHGGGLFIGSSSEIVPATPLENVFAFYDACHTYGRYPLQV